MSNLSVSEVFHPVKTNLFRAFILLSTLAVLLRDATTDELIGGLWGRSLWGSLYIDMMFVPAPLRRSGIGMSLLRQAEQEAMRRGCREMWTDTYAFQARSFYEKAGFTVFGHLDGPAPIFPRFFLKKELGPEAADEIANGSAKAKRADHGT